MAHSGRLKPQTSIFIVCDLQEKSRDKIKFFPQIVTIANRCLRGAAILSVHTIVTEMFPKGLGNTVADLGLGSSGIKVYEKMQYSLITPEIDDVLKKLKPELKQIVICGIEAHGSVLLSALNFVERGYEVHVLADGTSSKSQADRKIAFERMKQSGIFVTTLEGVLISWVKHMSHPQYADIKKILAEPEANSDLYIK